MKKGAIAAPFLFLQQRFLLGSVDGCRSSASDRACPDAHVLAGRDVTTQGPVIPLNLIQNNGQGYRVGVGLLSLDRPITRRRAVRVSSLKEYAGG